MITLTIPNDDHIALRAFGKALIEIASAKEGHPLVISTDVEERLRAATEKLQQSATNMMDELRFEGEEMQGKRKEPEATPTNSSRDDFVPFPEVDTTAQQVESLSDEQIADDLLVAASELLNVPPHVLAGQEEAPPTTDSTGTPWDERIHSTSKALNADGTWRLRRKPKDMDEEEWSVFIQNVQDELLGQKPDDNQHGPDAGGDSEKNEQNSNENNNIIPAEVEPSVTPPGDDFHTDADVVTEQTVAGIPPLPVPPPVVVAPPVPEVTTWDFPRLMTFLTERHGKIDVATVNTLLAQDGMSSVQELNAHPDKIGPFVARVKAHLGE